MGQWKEIQKAMENPAQTTMLRHSGWREQSTTLEKGVSFKMRDLSRSFRQVSSAMEGARLNGNIGQFSTLVQTHQALAQETLKHIQNLRTLRLDDDAIVSLISGGGVSKSLIFSLMDGQYQPPEFQRPKTQQDYYDDYQSLEGQDKIRQYKSLPPEIQRYINNRIKQETRQTNWTEREKYVATLGVANGERASHIMGMLAQEKRPDVKLKELYRKKIVNDVVLKQIRQMKLTSPQ